MLKNWKLELSTGALAIVLCTLGAFGAEPSGKAAVEQDDSVRAVLMQLQSAITSKSAEKCVALFANEATFIDQSGDEIQGNEALRERFDRFFNAGTLASIGIHPESIRFPAGNVALATGEVSHKRDNDESPVSRFSMVLVKKKDGWLINQLTETSLKAVPVESRLQDLNWMIGQWSAENSQASATLNVEWAPSMKFIHSKCTLNKKGMPPEVDTQVIGWDPRREQIVSWHFDSNGGFANGVWEKDPNQNLWRVHVAGTGGGGSDNLASNVFTIKSPDEYVWQSVNRSIDGAPVSDSEPINVHKVKQ